MQSHSQHIFIQSKKKDVSYCKICYKLSYKGKISQTLPLKFDNRFDIDRLTLKYKPITCVCNYELPNNIKYIEYKNRGISKIKYLINNFGLTSMIYFKSISFMNQIFLENNIPVNYIDNIAFLCVLLARKFNECCLPKKNEKMLSQDEKDIFYHLYKNNKNDKMYKTNLCGLFSFIKKNVDNYKYWEILCLKYLNYDLGRYSAYDYLLLFFQLGIFFSEKEINININIIDNLKQCIKILDLIIYDKKGCDFSQYTLALSIINIVLENNCYFNKKIIKYIYGIDFSKSKYIKCSNIIKNIINESIKNDYSKNYFNFLYNAYNSLSLNLLNNNKEININKDNGNVKGKNENINKNNYAIYKYNKNLIFDQLNNMIINNNNHIVFDNNINNNSFYFHNNKCIDNNFNDFIFLLNYYNFFNNNNNELNKNCKKNFQ